MCEILKMNEKDLIYGGWIWSNYIICLYENVIVKFIILYN
jgi:hypothetical protein